MLTLESELQADRRGGKQHKKRKCRNSTKALIVPLDQDVSVSVLFEMLM